MWIQNLTCVIHNVIPSLYSRLCIIYNIIKYTEIRTQYGASRTKKYRKYVFEIGSRGSSVTSSLRGKPR